MKNLVGKFSFAVPEGHPQQGEKIEKPYEYKVCESDEEANTVLVDRKWKFLDIINDVLKQNARSNAYQAALLPYRPSEVTPEDIKERMIRDYIRLGIPEEAARKQVEGMLAANVPAPVTE